MTLKRNTTKERGSTLHCSPGGGPVRPPVEQCGLEAVQPGPLAAALLQGVVAQSDSGAVETVK